MDDESTSITDAFLISLKDPCADNQLSIAVSDELGDQLYYVGDAAKVVTPVVAQTVSISTCPLTATLEYWDEKDRIWRPHADLTTVAGQEEYSGSAYTTSFVQSFITADTGVLTIYTDDSSIEYDPPDEPHTEVTMRITFTDPYSGEATNTVSDTFLVIIKNYCTINQLTLTESLGVLLQYVTDTQSSAYQLSFSATQSQCVITYTLFFWVETTQMWTEWSAGAFPFAGWTSSTGELTLQTNDYTNYDNFSIIARIYAEDLYSEVEEPLFDEIYDQFTIEVRDECHDIGLAEDGGGTVIGGIEITNSGSTASQASPFQFHLWE